MAASNEPPNVGGTRSGRRRVIVGGVIIGAGLLCYLLASGLLAEVSLWRAEICLEKRLHSQAMAWLNWAEFLRAPQGELSYLQAKTYRRQEHFAESAAALERALAAGHSRTEIDRERWLLLAQTGRFNEVHPHWRSLFLNAGSDGPEISRSFVLMSLQRFQVDHALRVIEVWKKDFPLDPEPYFQEGRIAGVGLRWQDAERAYRQAEERAPHRLDVREGLVESLMKQLKLDEAIDELQKLILLQPENTLAKQQLADCLMRTGKIDDARSLLKSALQTEPTHYPSLVLLGQLEASDGRAADACDSFKRAVALHPEDAEVRYMYARALRAAGRDDEAKEYFRFREEANDPLLRLSDAIAELVKTPANVDLRYEVADLTWHWKSRDEGAKWLFSVLEIEPRHRPAHGLLSRHFESLGRSDLAKYHRAQATPSAE